MTALAATLPPPLEFHRKAFELKLTEPDAAEGGTFTGIASAVGVLDRHNEVIEKGAFDKTLAEQGSEFVLLWQHNPSQPIGVINLSTDARGDLVAKGDINLDTQLGREAHALLKQGAIKAMSIGFNIPEGGMVWDEKAKHLRITAVDLWETSLVTFPANPGAVVQGVKDDSDALDRVCAIASDITARTKAGRVLSAANVTKLEAARDALQAVLDAAGLGNDDTDAKSVGAPETDPEWGGMKALADEMRADLDRRIRRDV